MKEVVIVEAKRTPIGKMNGMLQHVSAKDLAKTVLANLIEETKLSSDEIDEIIVGNVDAPSDAPNIGRIAALELGWKQEIPAYMVNQNCSSGMQALINGTQSIRLGDSDVSIILGTESMSQIPYTLKGARSGFKWRHQTLIDRVWEMLHDPYVNMMMGETAENVAEQYEITREEQDRFALKSYERAQKAQQNGTFAKEIVPVVVQERKGKKVFDQDELEGRPMTIDDLAKMKPAFKKDGTVTAGNACGINDGAAGVILMSGEKAKSLGLSAKAKIVSYATVGLDPAVMGLGPIYAVPKALERAGLTIEDIDLFEINEAFAAQTIACIQQLRLDIEKVNPFGGAIALGHPVGATGVRLMVTLLNGLKQINGRYGVATLCVGGGLGAAVVIERIVD